MSDVAVVTIVHGRHGHLRNQHRGLEGSADTDVRWIVVAMNDPSVCGWKPRGRVRPRVLDLPVSGSHLPLAAARNAGAKEALAAGATTLVFLDVDCVPDPDLVAAYRHAAGRSETARTLMCGPVSYLPPPPPEGYDFASLESLAEPHPARPAPGRDAVVLGGSHDLFWSLSFAVTADTWHAVGGFCDEFVGYGAEDTDFGRKAKSVGIDVSWIGGARAFHQYHPAQDPPMQHLEDIVRNSNLFHQRWGTWPMQGWLDSFAARGLVEWSDSGCVVRPARRSALSRPTQEGRGARTA